jgi:hypothetical protein
MDLVEKVAREICQSGKFECGQGRCAALCMDSLGDIRKSPHGCSHALKLHGPLARAALRIALEEAAKVAEYVAQSSDAKFDGVVDKARGGSKNLELAGATAIGMGHTARNIATTIRSLLPEEPTR